MGIGSISEVVELDSLTILESSLSVIHVNVLMVMLQDLLMSVSPPLVMILALIKVILFFSVQGLHIYLLKIEGGRDSVQWWRK